MIRNPRYVIAVHNLERRDGRWVPRPLEPTYVPAPYPWDDPDWVEWIEAD